MLQAFKAELFKALGHPVRIRILEILRDGEQTVSDLQRELGIEMSSVSQQLAVLRARRLVAARRAGTSGYYQVVDPQVFQLLDVARAIFNQHLVEMQAMVDTEDELRSAADAPDEAGGRAAP